MDHKSFFFYPFSMANITVDLNQQRKSWWKLTVIISGSTWPFLPSSPDPVVKISVTANLAVVKEMFQVCQWEIGKNLLGNISSISFFIIHLQPFQCHFLEIKVIFHVLLSKRKLLICAIQGWPALKSKSSATLFSKWSVLEKSASWKYHASALWAALGPTLCPSIGERLGNFFGDLARLALALGCAGEKGCRTGGGWALWWRKRNRL